MSVSRSAFANLTKLNDGNVFTGHASKCFASTQIAGTEETEDGPIKRFIKKFTKIDSSKSVTIQSKQFAFSDCKIHYIGSDFAYPVT